MMAKNKELRPLIYNISVVGLSGTEKEKGTSGVGKSCLCNRYVHPKADDYYPEHTSVLSTIDFGGRVVNNDHFLYWGDVNHISEEGSEYKVQLIEQSEFIDDQTFLPHRSTNLQPYIKRAAMSKLQSAEKLMYICTDQLGLEQDFEQKQMPDGKVTIDGFLLCIDVSKGCNRKFDDQLKFINNLSAHLAKTKKPIVIAATKCDECVDHYLREVQAFATNKKNMPVVETSARFHVNVDLCFAALIQILDKARGKTKIIPYLDAYKQQRQLVAASADKFERLIVHTVKDYHAQWKTVSNKLKNHNDYEEYITLEGTKKAKNTFAKHIEQLKQEHIRRRREEYIALLPKALSELLSDLDEIDHLNWSGAQSMLERSPNFPLWFVVLEKTPWDETNHIDNINDKRLPFDLLSTSESEKVYHNHVQHLIAERRRLEMKEKFKKHLEKIQFITPGKPWEEVLCFAMDNEAYKFITDSDRREVYGKYQRDIVEKAKEEFQEMLFEHSELFYDLDLNATPTVDKMSEINNVLNEEPRYGALQKLAPDRESLLLKHIGFVYHPTKETCLSGQNCMDLKVEQLLSTNLIQFDHSRPNMYQDSANIDKLNLVLLGRDGLAQELANEIRAQCTDDEYTLDGKIYELDLHPLDPNTPALGGLTTACQPHGCFCVYNSAESLNCVAECIERLRNETNVNRKGRFIANFPFTLILANQRDIGKNLPILKLQGQQLANKLQCPFVDVPPGTHTRKFHEFQIKQSLRGLLESLKHNLNVVNPVPSIKDLSEADLRIVMCAMCGDPFNVDLILSPFLESRFCSAAQPGHTNSLLLEKIIGEKRKRIQITILSYHSSICVRKDELVHGYILVYSAKRKASMAMLRAFLAEVQDVIPVQLVAVTDSQADFFENEAIKELMTEGEHIATEISAKFTTIYSLSQYHRQTEVFTPFFSEALEKKNSIENSYMCDSTREFANTSEDFSLSPRASSPAFNYYPDSEDDSEAPPPYSPIGDEVQLLPPSSDRSKHRSDFEGNEYPLPSSPVVNHDNHKVPPPIKPKPIISKHDVRKLDPNLVKTIEQGISKNPKKHNRGPFGLLDDMDPSDNYSIPRDALIKPKAEDDDIYSTPEDSKQTKIARKPNLTGGSHSQGDGENGLSKQPMIRKSSKYKYKSKTLFSKARSYYGRRERSDMSDEETASSSSWKPKKGKPNRGSEEDPLLSPENCGKAGIDNPAIASDPEVEETRRNRKDKKPPKRKGNKKDKSKGPKHIPPPRRNWDSNYFGVPLQDIVTPDKPVPLFIEKCVEYIESADAAQNDMNYTALKPRLTGVMGRRSGSDKVKSSLASLTQRKAAALEDYHNGLNSEGLYRVSGNKTDQDNIQRQFDQDHNIDLVAMDLTVNAVAGALKAFFSDLPEPLIPYNLHSELVEAAKYTDRSEKLNVLQDLLKKFPVVNYEVFKYVITHLNRVSQQSKTNRMTADNLSICFWPTLMRPDFENRDALTTTTVNQSIIETFIQQCHFFFYNGEIVEMAMPPGAPSTGQLVEPLLPLLPLPPPPTSQQFQPQMQTDQLGII